MCIDKLYDKIIRNSKEAEKQYVSMATNPIVYKAEKLKESPITDEAFKEQLERVLRDNVLDVDIRITGDTVIGAKINPEDKGLFLRSLSDETILKECKERGLDVKYSEETELAYRLNWVMQDYYKAGEDEEEREHRVKCYHLFWDALEDSEFFNRLESQKEELTKLQEKCKKFVEKQKEQKPVEWSHDDTQHRNKILLDLRNMQARYAKDKMKNWKDADFYDCCMKDNGENIEWLESLPERFNLQPKQELNEEDKQAIGFIFDLLNDLVWRKDWAMSKEECLERLKSLRPSWKPSEK